MMYGVPNMKAAKKDVVQRRVDLMAAEVRKKKNKVFLRGRRERSLSD